MSKWKEHWRNYRPPQAPTPQPSPAKKITGLGDVVAGAIKVATLGTVKPCGKCEERRAKLNAMMPFEQRQ